MEKIETKNIPKPGEVKELDSGKPTWPEAMVPTETDLKALGAVRSHTLIREHSKKQRDGESKDPEAEIRMKAIQEELKDLGDAMTILKAKAEGTKEDSKPRLVQNTLSGKIHSILIGPDLPESATTWCGWRYLGAAHELVGDGSSGNCKRCFRELRAARESGCTDSDSSNSSDTV